MEEVDRISILGAPNFAHVFSQTLIPKKYARAKMATVNTYLYKKRNTRSTVIPFIYVIS